MSLAGRADRLRAMARRHGLELIEAETPEAMRAAVRAAIDDSPSILAVSGGDGTVQAVITDLAELSDESQRPPLLVLGGGRTNYTARDLGTHADPLRQLERAIEQPESLRTTVRHSLIVRQSGQNDRHGFFIAGARVNDVIRDCHRYRSGGRGWLRQGHASSAWRVMQLGVRRLFGGLPFPPTELSVDAEDLGRLDGRIRILLLTTLQHPGAWIDPYADRGQGELRLDAIGANARRFWLRLPKAASGHFSASMQPEQGYLSGRCERVEIKGIEQICLDGQEHDYRKDLPLDILTGPAFRFLQP